MIYLDDIVSVQFWEAVLYFDQLVWHFWILIGGQLVVLPVTVHILRIFAYIGKNFTFRIIVELYFILSKDIVYLLNRIIILSNQTHLAEGFQENIALTLKAWVVEYLFQRPISHILHQPWVKMGAWDAHQLCKNIDASYILEVPVIGFTNSEFFLLNMVTYIFVGHFKIW